MPNPTQIFKDLTDYTVQSAKRDTGCKVTFAKAGDITRVIEIDRYTRIELTGASFSTSLEAIDRLVAIFQNLAGFEVHDAYTEGDLTRVLFLKGEEGKGLTFTRDAQVKSVAK